jgi:hypothetical protein
MVLTPSEATFDGLRAVMNSGGADGGGGSFDGGDQGVLNQWFSGEAGSGPRWNQLSFTYNVTPTAAYTYAPAYAHYGAQISVVHFIGRAKPWHTLAYGAPHSATNAYNDPARPYHYDALVGRWWSVYNRWVAPRLRVDGGAVAAAPERLAGGLAGKEGGFVGLPLDGRDDLIPPSRRPAAPEPQAEPQPPSSPPAREPSPEYRPQELQQGVPYFLPWDPATQDPPKTGAQMSGAFPTTDYSADWARKAAGGLAGAGDWVPDVPERLRHGRSEREAAQTAVFPWENDARPAPTRVFPGEPRRAKPATAKIGAPRPDLPPPASHPAPSSAPAHGVKQSFAQAMAGPSTNAWDADPAIQAYASRLTSPPPQQPAAHQARGDGGGSGRGSRGGDNSRSREQSRDGGADGDDEESTGGDDSDDEAEDDGGEGDRVVMRFRRDGPGGGAGAAGGGGGGSTGFGASRPVTFAGASSNGGNQGRGAGVGSGQHQHQQTQHHTSAEHHAMHSRAVQASTTVRNASTQYSPVSRTVPLPQPAAAAGVPSSAGYSTPPLESSRTATSAENSVLHTPSSQQPQQQRASTAAAPNGNGGAGAAFNARFGFDQLGSKTSQQPSSQGKVKTAGRTWGASLAKAPVVSRPQSLEC